MKTPKIHIALLRGVNVGGKNLIRMADLRTSFETMGFINPTTYIQSGNILFGCTESSPGRLEQLIEEGLTDRFRYSSRVVIVSHVTLRKILSEAPAGFGENPTSHRWDVIFLKKPLTPRMALKAVETREGVDEVSAGSSVLYFSRLTARASQSRMSRIVQKPEYQLMTIRNWNTVRKLLALADGMAAHH